MAKITIVPHDYDDFEITCGDQRVRVRVLTGLESKPLTDEKEDIDGKKDSDRGDKDEDKPKRKPRLGPFSPYIPLFAWPGAGAAVSHVTSLRVTNVSEIGSHLDTLNFRPGGESRLVVFLSQATVDMSELARTLDRLPTDTEVMVVLTRLDA